MNRIFLIAILAIIICCILQACLPIPHYHISLPKAIFSIHDSIGNPIPGAKITIYSGDQIGGKIKSELTVIADSLGIAQTSRIKQIHYFAIGIPDGEAWLEWAWSVSAPNRLCMSGWLGQEPVDTIHIVLATADTSSICPKDPKYLFEVVGSR